jgi:hypothetical protein
LTLKIDFINDMAFRYGDLQEALIKMREAIASLELAFSDDPSFFTAPIAINERALHNSVGYYSFAADYL